MGTALGGDSHYLTEMLRLSSPLCFPRWVMAVRGKASACCSTTACKMRPKHIKSTGDDTWFSHSSPQWDKRLSLLQLPCSLWPSLDGEGMSLETVQNITLSSRALFNTVKPMSPVKREALEMGNKITDTCAHQVSGNVSSMYQGGWKPPEMVRKKRT